MIDEQLSGPAYKDCAYCGEKVLASAIKCRHCGEFFDAAKVPPRSKAAAKVASVDDPNPAEYFVALLLAPIGLIIGLVWAAQKQPKAKGMLKTSVLSLTITVVAGLMTWQYVLREDNSGPSAAPIPPGFVPPPQFVYVPDGEQPNPGRNNQGGRPGDLSGAVDLEGQPVPIQRAMRANVKIELPRSLGSGVVIQRHGDEVLILTNHHVVTQSGDLAAEKDPKALTRPRITYYNEQSNPGTVVWLAPDGIDLAIIKAPAPKDVEAVAWVPSSKVLAGNEVFAVGNPIGFGWTLTKGVVSAFRQQKHGSRDVPIIQSDAKTTSGNSGGGLYNAAGELIGINTTIATSAGGAIGFAIRPIVLIDLKPDGLDLPASGETPAP